jgi:hypothetical protein
MLIGNYSVLNKNPGRAFGGSTVSETRAQWSKSGPARNRFYGVEDLANHEKYGTPNGYLPPYSWVIPQVSGGMASNTLLLGLGAFSSSIAGGKNATADLAGIGELTAPLQLVVSAVAALTGSGLIDSASAVAYLNATADLSGSGSASATLGALGHILSTIPGVGSMSVALRADGELNADLTPFTDLSPQSLAAAVWNASAAEYTDEGTFGYATAFLYYLAHHKIITDPSAGTYTVYDTDGTTVLYQADLYTDAAGTSPYSGTGAERREQFA